MSQPTPTRGRPKGSIKKNNAKLSLTPSEQNKANLKTLAQERGISMTQLVEQWIDSNWRIRCFEKIGNF